MLQKGRAKAWYKSFLISGIILGFLLLSSCTPGVQHLSGLDQQDTQSNLMPLPLILVSLLLLQLARLQNSKVQQRTRYYSKLWLILKASGS